MVSSSKARKTRNAILANLSAPDFNLLKPHLSTVDLPLRFQMEEHGGLIKQIYFVESGFISAMANGLGKRGIELGIIGPEGMTGLAVVMGADRASNTSFVQLAGSGQRLSSIHLRQSYFRRSAMMT